MIMDLPADRPPTYHELVEFLVEHGAFWNVSYLPKERMELAMSKDNKPRKQKIDNVINHCSRCSDQQWNGFTPICRLTKKVTDSDPGVYIPEWCPKEDYYERP